MNKYFAVSFVALISSAVVSLAASQPAPRGETIGEVATNLVRLARAGDASAFSSVVQTAGIAPEVLAMIQRSGMLTNHAARTQITGERARLDYHAPEQRTHFQVELERQGTLWRVKQIFLCR